MHDDTILDKIVTNHVLDEEGHCHPQQKDSCPLPKTPPNTPAILYGVGGVCLGCIPSARTPTHKYQFCVTGHTVQLSTVLAPSGYPIAVKLYATIHSVKSNAPVSSHLILFSFHLPPASINYFMDQLKFYFFLPRCSFHSCSNGTGNGS